MATEPVVKGNWLKEGAIVLGKIHILLFTVNICVQVLVHAARTGGN